MGTKRTKKPAAAEKPTTAKRTLNAGAKSENPATGAPFSEQDPKRRSGRFEGKGEFTRGGVRGK